MYDHPWRDVSSLRRDTGAANIRPDDTPYADGEITREGPVGNQGDGPYSAGRGGAGNIDKDGVVNKNQAGDEDIVPETAIRPANSHENYHYGRGGAGNEIHSKHKKEGETINQYGFEKKVPNESLKDRVKDLLHGHK